MISKNHIKYIQSLHSKKFRDEESVFIIEGIKLVTEFIAQDVFEVIEVLATGEFLVEHSHLLDAKQIQYSDISIEELKKISLQSNPNQVLAIVKQIDFKLNATLLNTSTTLYLDDIRDPGNLGTIIRIADWFGIKQVVCSKNCTELYNPKTVQASMGAILRVSVISMDFMELKGIAKDLPIYGALLQGENIYTTKLEKGIIVIGNEANGISDEVMNHISHPITIPSALSNGSESLNAANACAIICSEFHRQLTYSS